MNEFNIFCGALELYAKDGTGSFSFPFCVPRDSRSETKLMYIFIHFLSSLQNINEYLIVAFSIQPGFRVPRNIPQSQYTVM